jgi:hypothetical protein
MVHVILLCAMIVGDDGKSGRATPVDRSVYESAQSKAGKDAAAHLRLALWCEQHGLSAERVKHLALAIAYDPSSVLARGLAGLVSYQGKWQAAEEVERATTGDQPGGELIREYLERRAQAPQTADGQLKLAAWCAEHGLKNQALAHYTEVTRIDPSVESAWKHLGYTKKQNHWVKPDDATAAKLEAERQKRADQHWKPRLEKLRGWLESPSSTRREQARAGLAEVTDPRAVPMVMKVLATGGEGLQLAAAQVLSQIQGPAASLWLAALAIDSPSNAVRSRAADLLSRRDARDVIAWLIARLHRPYKYQIKPAQGPGSTAALLVDGEQFDVRRLYRIPGIDDRLAPPTPLVLRNMVQESGNALFLKPEALPFTQELGGYLAARQQVVIAAAEQAVLQRQLATQQTLDDDIRLLDDVNAQITETNDQVLPLLQTLTGQDYGANPPAWQNWWADQLGVVVDSSSSSEKPTYTDQVALPDIAIPQTTIVAVTHSCFAAGTMVHAIGGLRPIESLEVGDLVLSQNTTTGELAFQPVVTVHKSKPNATFKITVDQDSIVATGIHRFWKLGSGWTMARDLKAGDRLRKLGGVVAIASIESDATQPVYNLDVAQNRNFCVGKPGLLVHDFSFVQPVLAPFDAQGEPADGTPASALLRARQR